MTPEQWLASEDPAAMLEALKQGEPCAGRTQEQVDRRMRLFACACCRAVFHLLTDERSRRAVEVAEQYADGLGTAEEVYVAYDIGHHVHASIRPGVVMLAAECCGNSPWELAVQVLPTRDFDGLSPATHAALLRDIVGNPWRPATLPLDARRKVPCPDCPDGQPDEWCDDCSGFGTVTEWRCSWLTPTVLGIAQVAYAERRDDGSLDPDRLAVLADALEDAGCADPDIIGHLRGPEPHVRGCWCVDIILGKA